MRLRVSAQPDEISDLYDWLRADRNSVRHADITAVPSTDPATMSAIDVIDVLIKHAEAAAGLTFAFLAWRRSRPKPGPIEIVRADGKKLTIDGKRELTAEQIERFLADTDE
jgi:hypothetical protein